MLILIISIFNLAFSQMSNYRTIHNYETPYMYSAGINTHTILFDHPASKTIVFDNDENFISGGSFDGAQSGLDLRFTYFPEKIEKLYLSLGTEFMFFSAKEQYTVSSSSVVNYHNKARITTPYIGAYWKVKRIPLANTNIYLGPELRFNFIHGTSIKSELQNIRDRNKSDIRIQNIKENTFRLGSAIRLGAEGEINKEIGVNISFVFNMFNMLGRNDEYGELLTSGLVKESTEIPLYSFIYNISLFYRL
jgi:hypothetical protein